eukprot:TRINITY_DN9275_c0_g2_i4.p1 TRINITY_DN9275_c0_g2~~TRINITY_DN9275_c0_g2_i4.p1  ORF type:complete len:247 (+),score=20.43 TRINITY_DN9275_c0_g2_i4:212-952(+)
MGMCGTFYQGSYSIYSDYTDRCTIGDCSSCDILKSDRGWFKRFHDACEEDCDKFNAYPLVLAYGITCGIGWLLAGIFAIVGGVMLSRCWAVAAGCIFSVFYVVLIGLFAGVWKRINNFESLCSLIACEKYVKKIKRSTYEFLGYSICSFTLILFAILFSFISAYSIRPVVPTVTTSTLRLQSSSKSTANTSNWANIYLAQYNKTPPQNLTNTQTVNYLSTTEYLSLIHICRCRRSTLCRSRWSPYH